VTIIGVGYHIKPPHHLQKEPSLRSSGFEHKTLKETKFKTGTNRDYWLATTEIEHKIVVPLRSNVKMKSI
jgi:hypothetical protein